MAHLDNKQSEALRRWIAEMRETASRRVIIGNMCHDWVHQRIPRALLTSLLRTLAEEWTTRERVMSPENAICLIVGQSPEKYLCQAKGLVASHGPKSRVVAIISLLQNNVDCDSLSLPIRDCLSSSDISILMEADNCLIGDLRGERPMAWVTKSEELQRVLGTAGEHERADLARDVLGLVHFRAQEQLIEIVYPADAEGPTCYAPTVLDGAPSFVFRCARTDDNWGVTVDLRTLKGGLPEAVHPTTSIPKGTRMRWVGMLTRTPPSVNYEELAQIVNLEWDETIQEEIISRAIEGQP